MKMMMPRFVSSLLCVTVTLLAAAAVVQAQPGDDGSMMNETMPAMNGTIPAMNGTMTDDMESNVTVTEPVASLQEIIMSEPDLSTLAAAVNASDLFDEVLDDSDGYFTFFA